MKGPSGTAQAVCSPGSPRRLSEGSEVHGSRGRWPSVGLVGAHVRFARATGASRRGVKTTSVVKSLGGRGGLREQLCGQQSVQRVLAGRGGNADHAHGSSEVVVMTDAAGSRSVAVDGRDKHVRRRRLR
jgi:hypothetical protein